MQKEISIGKAYNELVMASFGQFQIGVLSAQTNAIRQFCPAKTSAKTAVAMREYDSIGWLFQHNYHLGWLQAVAVEPLENPGPFKITPRLGVAIPLSFEVRSDHPLPPAITSLSCFSCKFPETISPYYAIFRKMRPRYVKVFPFSGTATMPQTLRQFIKAEATFVTENRQNLVQVPFYKSNFGL